MANRACPNCSEIIPADVDYCPFCGKSTQASAESLSEAFGISSDEPSDKPQAICPHCHEKIPADVDFCPFCGNSTLIIGKIDSPPPVVELSGDAPKPILDGKPYTCLMCHEVYITTGDYCASCQAKLDLKPEEWAKENKNNTRTLIMLLLAGALFIFAIVFLVNTIIKHEMARINKPTSAIVEPYQQPVHKVSRLFQSKQVITTIEVIQQNRHAV